MTDDSFTPDSGVAGDAAAPGRRTRVADLERLLEVSRQLGATVELDPLLTAIADAATDVLDCERASVFLVDAAAGELSSRVATGIEDSPIREIRFPVGKGLAGEVARCGETISIPDAYADSRFNPEFDRKSGFRTRSLLALPLRGHDGGVVGVLQALNRRGGSFDAEDERLAAILCGQAGVAIQRQALLAAFAEKQRIQRELHLARGIQQALLPKEPPLLPGLDIAGWNRPADETGGDSFDFLPLADGTVAVALADATGHGIAAALVMSETRALLRAAVRQTADLVRVVREVNDLLCLDLPDGRFSTAFFGILAAKDRSLRFVSAGQGPILHHDAAADVVRSLPTHGLPLGIMPGVDYDAETSLVLAPGDSLVLLTDGFYEWQRADGEQFGEERVAGWVRDHCDLSATDTIAGLVEAVLSFAEGTPQADDLTAVVIRST